MGYKIEKAYCWYNKETQIVLMYFINQIPFTFDELPDGHMYDKDLKELADKQRTFEPEDLFKNSFYLIDEEAHPLLFEMDLENPQDLPEDIMEFDEEDLT
jgi:hypothetical protein